LPNDPWRMCVPPRPGGGQVVAADGPATGRADRDRSMRAGYLAESQHHMLPASRRSPSTANTISRRGPGQRLELTTGEPAFVIGRQATVRISTPPSPAVARRAQGITRPAARRGTAGLTRRATAPVDGRPAAASPRHDLGRILCGLAAGRWPVLRGQFGIVAAIFRLRACAYARDRSVPGLVRDIGVGRLRLCHGLGPRRDGQA
jgi:hypothetical protein